MSKHIHIHAFNGLGDNVYTRPFVKDYVQAGWDVWLKTPWPQLYSDIGPKLHLLSPGEIPWRTQNKNMRKIDFKWETAPTKGFKWTKSVILKYGVEDLKEMSILQTFEQELPLHGPLQFDLPPAKPLNEKIQHGGKPIAVVRPNTVRAEWKTPARGSKGPYVAYCAKQLFNAGYHVVSVADLQAGVEWIDGEEPMAHQKFHQGELLCDDLMSLIQHASVVVGGVGWIVPATIAAKTPLFIIFGGRGAFDQISKITDLRMDMRRVGWALPRDFCRCLLSEHQCNKTIPDLPEQFYGFMHNMQRLGALKTSPSPDIL